MTTASLFVMSRALSFLTGQKGAPINTEKIMDNAIGHLEVDSATGQNLPWKLHIIKEYSMKAIKKI